MAQCCPHLYDGERLEIIQGRPVLYRYLPSSSQQSPLKTPLLVFVPGAETLARISYGGHLNHQPCDFLAYWLNKAGFHVLAVSYPLESNPIIMPLGHAELSVTEWGELTAETARLVIEQESLEKEVVLLGWSMGGKIVKAFLRTAAKRAISVPLFISLAATPGGMTGLRANPSAHRSEAGYAVRAGAEAKVLVQVRDVGKLNGNRATIEDQVYLEEYFGYTPIRLANWGLTYTTSGPFMHDEWESLRDCGPENIDYAHYPYIGVLHGTSAADIRHVIADKATWGMVLTYKLLADMSKLPQIELHPRWDEIVRAVHSAPDRMHSTIEGNHFFFLGERGASAAAEAIRGLMQESRKFEVEFSALLRSD